MTPPKKTTALAGGLKVALLTVAVFLLLVALKEDSPVNVFVKRKFTLAGRAVFGAPTHEFKLSGYQNEVIITEDEILKGTRIRFDNNRSFEDVKLTVVEVETEKPALLGSLSPAIDIYLGDTATTFDGIAEITLPLQSPITNPPVVGHFDPGTKEWLFAPIDSYDSDGNTVTFKTNHFSVYEILEFDIGGMEQVLNNLEEAFRSLRPMLTKQRMTDLEKSDLIDKLTALKEASYIQLNEMQVSYDACRERTTCQNKYGAYDSFLDALANHSLEQGVGVLVEEIVRDGAQRTLGIAGRSVVKGALGFVSIITFGWEAAVYGDCIMCFLPNSVVSNKFWKNFLVYSYSRHLLKKYSAASKTSAGPGGDFMPLYDSWIRDHIRSGALTPEDNCTMATSQGTDKMGARSPNVVSGDLNLDGKADALMYFYSYRCDGGNAPGSLFQVIFLSSGAGYVLDDKYLKEYNLPGLVTWDSLANGKIYGHIRDYAESDARCCPSIIKTVVLDYKGFGSRTLSGGYTHVVHGVSQDTSDPFLNVRSGPSPATTLIVKLQEGAKVKVLNKGFGPGGVWWLIQYSDNTGDTGYVHRKYLRELPESGLSSCSDIDGNTYRTIEIGETLWMAENLRTTRYRNGDPIPNVTDDYRWGRLQSGAWCYYNNDPKNDLISGKLYNFWAVRDSRGLCPAGWKVPAKSDWDDIALYWGTHDTTLGAEMLRTEGERSGFDAVANNSRSSGHGGFISSPNPSWWDTRYSPEQAGYQYISVEKGWREEGMFAPQNGLAIRCIKNL